MKQGNLKEWAEKKYPRHFASLRRQAATHERAVQRKASASALENPPTRKQLKQQRAIETRIAKGKARRAKHARKLARV